MKAILVVDTHKVGECKHCPMYYVNEDSRMSCFVDDAIMDIKDKCPLKSMPEKKEILDIRDTDDMYDVFANKINVGYNRCIEDILGEEEYPEPHTILTTHPPKIALRCVKCGNVEYMQLETPSAELEEKMQLDKLFERVEELEKKVAKLLGEEE